MNAPPEPIQHVVTADWTSGHAERLFALHRKHPELALTTNSILRLEVAPPEAEVRAAASLLRERYRQALRPMRKSGTRDAEALVPEIKMLSETDTATFQSTLESFSVEDFGVVVAELDAYGPVVGLRAPGWLVDKHHLDRLAVEFSQFLSEGSPSATGTLRAPCEGHVYRVAHDDIASLELPFDRPRPERDVADAHVVPFQLSTQYVDDARDIAATAFVALLARYTGQSTFSVSILQNLKDVSGPLLHTQEVYVAPVSVSLDTEFQDITSQLSQCLDQSRPACTPKNLSRASIEIVNTPVAGFVDELEWELATVSTVDIALRVSLRDEKLICALLLAKDVFERETARQVAGHFELLFQRAVKSTARATEQNRQVWGEELLTKAERDYWRNEFNASDTPIEDKFLVHEIIEETAISTPSRLAIKDDDVEWTYATLNENANRVAHMLIAHGVEEDVRVSIFSERYAGFLASIFGVFKAGGAFVPIDPHYPSERVTRILSISGSRVILHDSKSEGALKTILDSLDEPLDCILINIDETMLEGQNLQNPKRRCSADSLAYVIFTSGSTGLPKGAMVEQKGMRNHLFAKALDLEFGTDDRILQNASQCFDISVFQFLVAALKGGMVRVVSNETALDPRRLLTTVVEDRITVLEMVPSLGRAMIKYKSCIELLRGEHHLRWLILTGEAIPPALVGDWLAVAPNIPILNAYGPTECSDDVSHEVLSQALAPHVMNTPVGKPIANMRLYVLDRARHIAPIGVHGELWITGIGVGRGYLNDEERTRLAFHPNTIDKQSATAYKTGDRIRLLRSGTLEFLGRIDHQVKIRGHRIELGEIETALLRHPDVSEAVVIGVDDDDGAKALVGYFVAPATCDDEMIKAHLRNTVPAYMVPSALVRLDEMPLSPNGKIQRSALPAPRFEEAEYIPPKTTIESKLEGIWKDILRRDRVSVDSDFFALGGDSLMAVRMFAQIQSEFDLNLQIARLFESPTITQLAAVIQRKTKEPEVSGSHFAAGKSVVPIRVTGGGTPFFCIHGGGGNVLNFYHLARLLPMDIDFYGIQARGVDGRESPLKSLEEMADRYLKAIEEEVGDTDIILGGFSGGGLVALRVAQRLRERGVHVRSVVLLDTYCPELEVVRSTFAQKIGKFKTGGFSYVQNRVSQIVGQKKEALSLRTREFLRQELPHSLRERKLFDSFERAEREYTCTPYDGSVILVRAEVTADHFARIEMDLGWSQYLSDLTVVSTPGDHETMVREPHVETLADILYNALQNISKT